MSSVLFVVRSCSGSMIGVGLAPVLIALWLVSLASFLPDVESLPQELYLSACHSFSVQAMQTFLEHQFPVRRIEVVEVVYLTLLPLL